jgi:tetratricopeptide (TPR) repeat protein
MQLNVKAYPNSPNAYDSLGDAYFAAGQRQKALEATKKTLELLPTDTTDPQQLKDAIKASADGKLEQLGATEP